MVPSSLTKTIFSHVLLYYIASVATILIKVQPKKPTNKMEIKSTMIIIFNILSVFSLCCLTFLHASDPPLSLDYYKSTCPNAEAIVRKEMECAVQSDLRNAAFILRLHFHDCFVQVCLWWWSEASSISFFHYHSSFVI